MSKQAKVSILVPIYNVEKYLHECIDSILNQTLQDIEIILINDGSTDNSVKNTPKKTSASKSSTKPIPATDTQ